MIRKKVWSQKRKANVYPERSLVGCKWVFKVKHNGVYRARLVALGYSQIPGVDYTDNYAPVVNDVTLRVALTIRVQKKWKRKNLDVETAFLEGELKEKIYMKPPPGFLVILEDMQEAIFKEATDESRKSVTGFMVYFCGVLVAWKSKMQKT